MAVASSCVAMPRQGQPRRGSAAFTLVEVMIALTLVSMLCMSAFAGMRLISNLALTNSIRTEAHRLLQQKAESLTSGSFSSFAASSDETITSVLKTTFAPGKEDQFTPMAGSGGRVSFTRRVVAVASTTTTRTLRVEVQWTWQRHAYAISTQLFRSM